MKNFKQHEILSNLFSLFSLEVVGRMNWRLEIGSVIEVRNDESKAVAVKVKGQLTDFRRWNSIGIGDCLVRRKGESP